MATKTHDYDQLKKEFLRDPDLSIRELCRRNNIKGYSSVALYARNHGWYEEKDRIRNRASDRMVEKVAERIAEADADEIEQFRTESLTIIRAALYKFAENLQDPQYRLRADDIAKLVQLGLLITGQPTSRTEERRLDVVATFDGLPRDLLRTLAEATRPRPAVGLPEGGPARTGDEGSRPN
jgi:hypothetical protein